MTKTATARHSGNLGDTLAALPALKEFNAKTGKKIIFYLVIGQKAFYYKGAKHPVKDTGGDNVMLNKYMFDMAKPLLMKQPFIEDVREWKGEEVEINLDIIRETFVNMPYGSISRWYFYIYPDLACDLADKWLTVPSTKKDLAKRKIIINRTQRYLNPLIDYKFLKKYEEHLIFAGVPKEHELFCKKYKIDIPLLKVNNFLELAQAIKQCKVFLGNQSQAFQLAEGQKTPRIVELCYFAPNVIPFGKNGYDFYGQKSLEYYVEKLFNEKG